MTVAELIAELKTYDGSAVVEFAHKADKDPHLCNTWKWGTRKVIEKVQCYSAHCGKHTEVLLIGE